MSVTNFLSGMFTHSKGRLYQEYGQNNPEWTEDILKLMPDISYTIKGDAKYLEILGDVGPVVDYLSELAAKRFHRDHILHPFRKAEVITAALTKIMDENPQIFSRHASNANIPQEAQAQLGGDNPAAFRPAR